MDETKQTPIPSQSHELLDELERQEHVISLSAAGGEEDPSRTSTLYLDGLRGLAALFVFIQHYLSAFDQSNVHEHGFGESGRYYHLASFPFLRLVFSGGIPSVAIFFVLSGYVLSKTPLLLLRNGRREACYRSLVSALIRRPIRLYGPPLGVTLVFAIFMHIIPPNPGPDPKENVFIEILTWLLDSMRFFSPFRTHGRSDEGWFRYNLILWTIPIELKGSVLIYILIALSAIYIDPAVKPYTFLVFLCLTTLILLYLGVWTMACFISGHILTYLDIWSITLLHLFPFSITNLLPTVLTTNSRLRTALLSNLTFLLSLYLLSQPSHTGLPTYSLNTPGWTLLTHLIPGVYYSDQYYRFYHSIGAFLLLFSLLHLRLSWPQSFLSTRPLQSLGRLSYGLYLVHIPLLLVFGYRLNRMLGHPTEPLKSRKATSAAGYGGVWWGDRLLYIPDVGPIGLSSRFVVDVALMLPVCLTAAWWVTKGLDGPCVRAGRWIVRALGLEAAER